MSLLSMSSLHYVTLKVIKQQESGKNGCELSTTSLGKILSTSQQTASRIIIDLTREGYLERSLVNRRQSLRLTKKALDLLFSEYNELGSLLDQSRTISLTGIVEGGLGEGRYYISRKNYVIQFQEKLGYIPYLGTLNLRMLPSETIYIDRLRNSPGIRIEGFSTDDRTFGPVKAFRATAEGVECAVIMPERTVHSETLELISKEYLRERLHLSDGSRISVEVQIKD
ncbi:MAG: DUF120 domain-containing protein [Thermoplasmataceae archaeon]